MSGVISKPMIEQIRDANDIVEVINAYVPLKRAGGAFKALCPFHKEKTPSFTVNPQRQIFHCFGCGAGGDVFRFLMQYEGLDFPSAARRLAERAGVRVEWTGQTPRSDGPDKDALYKLHEDVAALYQEALAKLPEAEAARRYASERALDETILRDFRIGYAPDRWDFLLGWARKKGFPAPVLDASGLLSTSEDERGGQRTYDRFRGRLMFPIRDELGRVVGFSGRLLKKSETLAKYVNSPGTSIFNKGRVIYALDRARRAIFEGRAAILCEGQIDVIRCHAAGFAQAVAAQGTALTEQHATILKRYADEAIIVLDADTAGQDASLRSAELLLAAGLSVRIASLPAGEDPDSLILRQGAAGFQAVLDAARPLLDFQIDLLRRREDLSGETGLLRAGREILATIVKAPTAIQRDHLLRQAAESLGIDETALRQDLRRMEKPTAGAPSEARPAAPPAAHPPHEIALIEILILYPETAGLVRRYVPPDEVTDPVCRCILEHALAGEGDLMASLADADAEIVRLAARIQMAPAKLAGEEAQPEDVARDVILVVRRKAWERKRAEVQRRLKAASAEERRALEVECTQLTLDIKALQQGWEKAQPILDLE